jgi:hypothetical protein
VDFQVPIKSKPRKGRGFVPEFLVELRMTLTVQDDPAKKSQAMEEFGFRFLR